MRKHFINLINKEIRAAKKKKPASIVLKMNSLVDIDFVNKLYEAVKAGVDVQMIIRGICCAYTEQKSFHDHMHAISIIDQYLEHARVFIFNNSGKTAVYISSADWMVRNLDHRIEAACPIYNTEIQQELTDILNIQLAENVKGRILDNEQSNNYVQRKPGEAQMRSQLAIYKYLHNKKYQVDTSGH
jgi:polyphosphate kinase